MKCVMNPYPKERGHAKTISSLAMRTPGRASLQEGAESQPVALETVMVVLL